MSKPVNKSLSVLVLVLVAAIVAGGVVHLAGSGEVGQTVAAKESAYDRVMRTNVLRCGYVVYLPNLVKDPNTGAMSGISYDIVMRLGHDLGIKMEWAEETGTASMIEGLNAGRYDLVCSSVWANSARGKAAEFSIPLYFTGINAYTRMDDDRFQNGLKAVGDGVSIATIDGGLASAIAREDYPQVKTYSLPELTDFSHLLLAVKDKHADVTFSEVAQTAAFDKAYPGALRNITPEKPVRLFANAFMMKMGENRFAEMLNNAIRNLHNNGFIEKTLAAHETQPDQYRRVMPGYR
jgi:ABC-type amino acid transport substrate-binding protein